MVEVAYVQPIGGSCDQFNARNHINAEEPRQSPSLQACCPPYSPSYLLSVSDDKGHRNDGSKETTAPSEDCTPSSLQTDEGTSMPPLMDLHRLQTDEESCFSQASLPPMMDLHRLQTDEDAYFSQSMMPPMMELTRLKTDEEAYFPPMMDLHRLQTDEDAYFSQASIPPIPPACYVQYGMVSPTCNPPPMTMAPTMTSPPIPSPPGVTTEDASFLLGLRALLQSQSSGDNTKGTAACTNPYAGGIINKSIPSAPVLSPSAAMGCAAPNAKTPQYIIPSSPMLSPSATPHETKTDCNMTPTMRPVAPGGVNKCTEARQPQVIKPVNTEGKTAQELQAKSLKKQNTEGKTAQELQAANQAKSLKKKNKTLNKGGEVSTENPTTLMIRGIPCSFSPDDLMTLIDDAGLKDKYDFFYLPTDHKKPSTCNKAVSLGYAFVNFVDTESAEYCTNTFTGVPLAPLRSVKKCAVSPADIQGIKSLQKHFHRTAVSRGAHGPMFLKL